MSRRIPLLATFAAHTISLTGNMITLIAVPLYVLDTTGSASLTGVAAFSAVLPVVLGGAFGGVIVDRIGYRRASYIADMVGGVTILAVPLLHFTVGLPFWGLMALLFATGLLDTPGQAARTAAIPELAEMAGMPLERAVGINESLERGSRLIGAPVAGLLVAVLGPLNTLIVDAATFGVAAALIAVLVPKSIDRATARGGRPGRAMAGYWADLRDGVLFLYREPLLRSITVLLVITNSFDIAWGNVILPIYTREHFDGAVSLGLLVAAFGGGALAGSLLFSVVGHKLPRRAVYVAAFLIAGGPRMLVFSAGPDFWLGMITVVMGGFAAGAINPIIGTVRLERTPPGMRARVGSAMGASAWAGMPLGALLAGVAIDAFGMTTTLRAIGVAYLLIVLVPLVAPAWRTMNDRREIERELVKAT
jgi:MFS family permease